MSSKKLTSRCGVYQCCCGGGRHDPRVLGAAAARFPCVCAVSYTHLRAHETSLHLVCRLLLEKKFFLMIRRPPRSTHCISSAASDVYKRQHTLQTGFQSVPPIKCNSPILRLAPCRSEGKDPIPRYVLPYSMSATIPCCKPGPDGSIFQTLNPKPQTSNPKPGTRNPKPYTLHPKI